MNDWIQFVEISNRLFRELKLVLSDNFLINHQQIKIREEAERKEN